MVRVIPVHNFLSQNVGQIDEPTATCSANVLGQDMLLLALSSHCVKVYSLVSTQSKLITIFPTVDMVKQLLHCDKGNYVATLESKTSRDGTTTNTFVRIYVNWEMSGNQNQAMRARIAGRVTPSLNRTLNSLEMIELPLNSQPTQIACCQTTGNLLVAMGNDAVIHELKVETHHLSKHKFLDFEIRPWSLKFSFQPSYIEIAEEFISVMNCSNSMLIKLRNRLYDDIKSITTIDSIDCKNKNRINQKNTKIDTKVEVESKRKSKKTTKSIVDFSKSISNETSFINWDQLVFNETEELQRLESLQLLDSDSKNFSITLPSIRTDQSQFFHNLDPPLIPAPEINATIITKSNEEGWSESYSVEYLLRLKIPPATEISLENGIEYFTCGILKPCYYRSKSSSMKIKESLLRSKKFNVFNGVTCLICTTQEGYLYHFSPQSSEEVSSDVKSCTIYPFTSPVSHVALENTALHALTEAGLESYTLRIPDNSSKRPGKMLKQSLIERSNDDLNKREPISLIGLRPFLGVRKLLHAAKCLVLLASDGDSWTYYSLSLPNPEDVYNDILNAANNHKETSPLTYKHLLGEAFTVLNTGKDVVYYCSDSAYYSNINETSRQHLDNLYKQSCSLLADYYITSDSQENWNLSCFYYKIAGLDAPKVLERMDVNSAPGLVTYLSEILLNLEPGPEADAVFQEHNIVEILATAEKEDLIKLILASPVLREYATEKLINLLSTFEQTDSSLFALVLLYTQAGKQNQAEKVLEPISNSFIENSTLKNWSWLFDVTNVKTGNAIPTFSEYAGIFMRQKMNSFAKVLARLVERQAITLNQMIQIFLAYLPSRVGRDGRIAGMALQLTLETYLQNFYGNFSDEDLEKPSKPPQNHIDDEDFAIIESFKILVRSYLAELTQANCKSEEISRDEKVVLFGSSRPKFLDCPELYEEEKNRKDERRKFIVRPEVLKLQALLASGHLPNECFQEVERFLEKQSIDGSLSFKILCAKDTEKAIQLLLEHCPQVSLHYAKEKYTEETEWKHFVLLLINRMTGSDCNPEIYSIYDEILRDTAIHIAQIMSMRGLKHILPIESVPALQQYIEISSQVVHADYIKTMIMGTGHHLLSNIDFDSHCDVIKRKRAV